MFNDRENGHLRLLSGVQFRLGNIAPFKSKELNTAGGKKNAARKS